MKTAIEVKDILDKHEQKRQMSCFQSAVEMVLKLYDVIDINDYPEQNIVTNDMRGFEPFSGKQKKYGNYSISFEEIKFEPFGDALQKGLELIEEGVYPIFSFRWPTGGYHGFVGYKKKPGVLSFITKKYLGLSLAEQYEANDILPQDKTEILVVKVKE